MAAAELDCLERLSRIMCYPEGGAPQYLRVRPSRLIAQPGKVRMAHYGSDRKYGRDGVLLGPDVDYGSLSSFPARVQPGAYMAGLDSQECPRAGWFRQLTGGCSGSDIRRRGTLECTCSCCVDWGPRGDGTANASGRFWQRQESPAFQLKVVDFVDDMSLVESRATGPSFRRHGAVHGEGAETGRVLPRKAV